MAYLALYRRFRPQGFDSLIGQDHISKILKNQIATGKIGHAYLFCGARGTGKTTVAKVFARAINCLSPVNGSPCGKCQVCKELKDSSNMDILEMDAASNNSVEDVREMREKIQYPPVTGRYKVYIVDEVHMLSPQAFNALLKTLEEPPQHAVFIFATTEVHKIPQTILSRCMRFDFKLIALPELSALIKRIFDEIGKEYEDEAVDAIARAGEGSARDSLSIADMCSSYSQGKLTYKDVLDVLGATDKGKVLELVERIISADTGRALDIVNELAMLGKNMGVLASDIASTLRDLMICATSSGANAILSLPQARFEQYKKISSLCDKHRLLRLIDIFTSLDNAFRYSTHPRIVLETAVVRGCRPDEDYNLEALMSRMTAVETAVKNGVKVVRQEVEASATSVEQKSTATQEQKKQESFNNPVEKITEKPVAEADVKSSPEQSTTEQFGFVSMENTSYDTLTDEDAPPEDIGALPEYDMFTMPKTPEKKQQANLEKPRESQVKETIPPERLWGNVLRTLRSNGNAVLWAVCRDIVARASEGELCLVTTNESEYEMFTREDHYKTLSEVAKGFGDYKVKILRTGETKKDAFDEDVEKLKQTFGAEIVKIKE